MFSIRPRTWIACFANAFHHVPAMISDIAGSRVAAKPLEDGCLRCSNITNTSGIQNTARRSAKKELFSARARLEHEHAVVVDTTFVVIAAHNQYKTAMRGTPRSGTLPTMLGLLRMDPHGTPGTGSLPTDGSLCEGA